ncbi:hypothetical protein HMPREF9374_1087 [Desmospora sp. 8437]|nr:hypothetical protein HMPREF9374_1087 [Desmospora sp. 8437]
MTLIVYPNIINVTYYLRGFISDRVRFLKGDVKSDGSDHMSNL